MSAHGKHRRPKRRPLSRGIALASTGGAALALPLVATATAHAAPSTAPEVASVQKTFAGTPVKITESIPAAANSGTKAAKTYTVVRGDSLSVIAHEQGVRGGWKALYQANRSVVGDNPSLIHPGLELSLKGKPATAPKAKAQPKPKPAERTTSTERADRSQQRSAAPASGAGASAVKAAPAKAAPAAAKSYTNDLDGWIRESLDVMAKYGIPGSYDGIHRNILRESSGNPQAINLWDSNAVKGTPSKGLLQVIEPTFLAYHVPGTSMDLFDPVANITAACNYAADRYGSIDNVNGPY
ncbi:LysM peptidoglycan-binding domain-containing protein [Streptomyces sp. Je 1-79]|uniref:transglycosylase SLT domain-containing protein n=1 Tax=Streptomyces sp. Je 1-79 TaxID=2943847 RepID=UPI0021A6FDC1|nr:LysM peptidoglycan-binding domain-containing protein [Streptomyces sp. Je 1-79]MCT4357561.1 LysM peptidoglycan-binding domain-containing protein [Streptomyces sp. Je 1-79]